MKGDIEMRFDKALGAWLSIKAKMKIIGWNIKGLNSPIKRRMLLNLVKNLLLDIVLIEETKCNTQELEIWMKAI